MFDGDFFDSDFFDVAQSRGDDDPDPEPEPELWNGPWISEGTIHLGHKPNH